MVLLYTEIKIWSDKNNCQKWTQLRIQMLAYPLYQYLSGALSYEEVLKAADTAGKMTELETFVGLKDYVDGDNSSAISSSSWSKIRV